MKDLEDKDFSIPVHRTNNLFLRFLANKIFAPIYDLFLGLYLRWGTTYRVKDNIMDKKNEKIEVFRLGFPFQNREIYLSYKFKEIILFFSVYEIF